MPVLGLLVPAGLSVLGFLRRRDGLRISRSLGRWDRIEWYDPKGRLEGFSEQGVFRTWDEVVAFLDRSLVRGGWLAVYRESASSPEFYHVERVGSLEMVRLHPAPEVSLLRLGGQRAFGRKQLALPSGGA